MTGAGHLEAVRELAAAWIVRLQEEGSAPDGAGVRAECEAWCAAAPRHRQVFEQMQELWGAMANAGDSAAGGGAVAGSGQRKGRSRPRVRAVGLLSLSLVAALAVAWRVGGTTSGSPLFAAWRADEYAAVGETRRVVLPDGSRLTLNSGSALNLDYGPQCRCIRLLAGEVLAEVAPDARRPFTVQGRDGDATARGTRYLVRQDAADTTVTVLEHSVDVAVRSPAPDAETATHAHVNTGQSVRLNASGVGEVHEATAGEGGWADGRLVFIDAPLPQVLAELARRRPGWVRAPAGELARLRFTGVLPARESEQALAQLERALPLRVRRATDFLVWVEPAAAQERD